MNQFRSHFALFCLALFTLTLASCSQNSPDAVFNRGLRAYDEGDYLAASIHFEDFVKRFPEDERALLAYVQLARSYLEIRDFASARDVFQKMKEQFPQENVKISSDFQIAETYAQEGFFDQAAQSYQQILSATDNPVIQSQAYTGLGRVYAREMKTEPAIETFDHLYQLADTRIEDPTASLNVKLQALASKAQIYQASEFFDLARDTHMKALDELNNATGIAGLEPVKQKAIIDWAHTWAYAGDFISSATIYDQLHTNPHIQDEIKPQLIQWKVDSLMQLFHDEENDKLTPEETAVVVQELQRIVDGFPATENSLDAKMQIAQLVKDSTPELSEQYLADVVSSYEKFIQEPPSPERPIQAMFQIAQSYIMLEKFDKAKEAVNRILQTYSQNPQAMQMAEGMLNYIKREEIRREQAAANPVPATDAVAPEIQPTGDPAVEQPAPLETDAQQQ